MRRREFITFLGSGAIAWPLAARAQGTGPNIRLVVGFSAGGATDIAARVLAGSLSQKLGQQVFVENRTGAGGTLATQEVAGAAPDGTTLLVAPFANATNETLFKDFRYKYDDYFTAVAPVAQTDNVLVVHPIAERSQRRRSHCFGKVAAAGRNPGSVLRRRHCDPPRQRALQHDGGHQTDLGAVPRRR